MDQKLLSYHQQNGGGAAAEANWVFVQLAYEEWKVKSFGLTVALLAQVGMTQLIKLGHFWALFSQWEKERRKGLVFALAFLVILRYKL